MATKKTPKKSSTKPSPAAAKKAAMKKASARKDRGHQRKSVGSAEVEGYVVLFGYDATGEQLQAAANSLTTFIQALKAANVVAIAETPELTPLDPES